MPGLKKLNNYSKVFGGLYDRTPKSVFAAVAYSYCSTGGDLPSEAAIKNFLEEWRLLHQGGIVPQKPAKN